MELLKNQQPIFGEDYLKEQLEKIKYLPNIISHSVYTHITKLLHI